MARQSTAAVQFDKTVRPDEGVIMTSGRAGKVVPIKAIPLLRGDSASGKVAVDIELSEMPRPLQNAVMANMQAWFVPKGAFPQFSGSIDLMHAYTGEQIKTLTATGEDVRDAPPFFFTVDDPADLATFEQSKLCRTLGLHPVVGQPFNTDYIDAFSLIYNFRLAAHSSRLPRRPYAVEDLAASTALPRAFWPKGALHHVVPDYERALVVGDLTLDVVAGQLPVSGLFVHNTAAGYGASAPTALDATGADLGTVAAGKEHVDPNVQTAVKILRDASSKIPEVFAEMSGQSVGVTLADIDKARTLQSFARLRATLAGNDATGFDNDAAILGLLMQGINVPAEDFKRPWLLDSRVVPFNMVERFATDAANLDESVSVGRAQGVLSINVPRAEDGGIILVTVEVVPERILERMSDEYLQVTDVEELPNALRDVLNPEPVDTVLNRRVDARHATPGGGYGFEPMNAKWQRRHTRLGGAFYQEDPSNPWTEQRSAIWQTSVVDPEFTDDHYLCPDDLPHDVFSDTQADAFELVSRHMISIVGLTQFGDVLAENNDDYAAIAGE